MIICDKCNCDITDDYIKGISTFLVHHGHTDLVKVQLCNGCGDQADNLIETWLKEPAK